MFVVTSTLKIKPTHNKLQNENNASQLFSTLE